MPERRRAGTMPGLDLVRLRLWSGLVLFLFAATHLANHALGLFSLAAMEAGRAVFVGFWRTPPAELVLLLSLLLHVGLAF
jgi:adenylate cyclase